MHSKRRKMPMSNHNAMLALIAATPAVLLASYGPSRAEIVNLKADLKGSEETPPSTSGGTGTFTGTYDTKTKQLTWTISYTGLTGPVTRADFHGPAGAGKYGSIKVCVIVNHSPIEGSAILTKPTAKALDNDLLNGKFYINLHTAAYPRGEIRGQIAKAL
jgi:CHRD domain